jgi:hypothetical protein
MYASASREYFDRSSQVENLGIVAGYEDNEPIAAVSDRSPGSHMDLQ